MFAPTEEELRIATAWVKHNEVYELNRKIKYFSALRDFAEGDKSEEVMTLIGEFDGLDDEIDDDMIATLEHRIDLMNIKMNTLIDDLSISNGVPFLYKENIIKTVEAEKARTMELYEAQAAEIEKNSDNIEEREVNDAGSKTNWTGWMIVFSLLAILLLTITRV